MQKMKKKMSICSLLLSNLDQNIKDRILNLKVAKESLSKFREKEKKETVRQLTDLRDIKSKSEGEVYDILNTMVKNNQYFMYCGPLLININPGPNKVKDYLNLQSWVKETESKNENDWKPHLYSFMYYVYQTLVSEKKDQVVNMLGQIGSGKTFNIIHIIEYYCCMVGPDNFQIDTFDIIHKSIQLMHIMGSIFRQNNLESTSCGMLLRLGFGNDNKICNFDFDAKILDVTLPFSENGRSYSVLHSFVTAASAELKRNFNIPDEEFHLQFFRKFSKNFSQKTKDRFKLNDYEIWNRFHSLLKFFDFSKTEVIEILQIFSFMLTLNELGMTKATLGKYNGYNINKGQCSKKLAKNFNMDEDEFIKQMGFFKDITEVKNTLISLMKYSYYIAFEFIQKKIKNKLKIFFNNIYINKNAKPNPSDPQNTQGSRNPNINNSKTNSTNASVKLLINPDSIKYINFLDFPGEVDDSTLGGLFTNLANECINLYAGNSYSSVVEKLIQEKLFLKLFKPLHCYQVVRSVMGEKGFFSYLSNAFTEENYNSLRKEATKQNYYKKCVEFCDINSTTDHNNFKFKLQFSHKVVTYNYESLYLETKSIINATKAYKVFALSKNSIIRSTYQKVVEPKIDFFNYAYKNLYTLFGPLENLDPFVIYCLHSNNSFKLFFGNNQKQEGNNDPNWVIPRKLTMNMLKKSLCIPVLYWEWFGYHEWIEIDNFVKEVGPEFEKIDAKSKEKKVASDTEIGYNQLNNYEKTNYILSSLFFGKDAVIGKEYILMKRGTLDLIKRKMAKVKAAQEAKENQVSIFDNSNSSINTLGKGSKTNSKQQLFKKQSKIPKGKKSLIGNKLNLPKTSVPGAPSTSNDQTSKSELDRRMTLKTQCHLDIIEPKEDSNKDPLTEALAVKNPTCTKYNLYRILEKNTNDYLESMASQSGISAQEENKTNVNDKDLAQFRKKNNIIIPDKERFNMVQGLFDFNKNTNFNIFDYSKVEPEILTIQCAYRVFKAKQKHLLLRYLMMQISFIQAHVRGLLVRRKFERLKKCLMCISMIQRNYKKHYDYRSRKAIIIQKEARRILAHNKATRKLNRYKQCLETGDDYADTSDEEKQKMISEKKQRQLELLEKARKKGNTRKSSVKSYKSTSSVTSAATKKNGYDLTREKDKSKIISAILLDKDLMKENEKMNRQLANAKGVKKEIKYELLQIDTKTKKGKKSSQDNKGKKMRIEDKLLEYGENLRQKRAQEQVDKLKTQEMAYTFKPNIYKNNPSYLNKFNNKNFYTRAQYFEEAKESKLEQIKTTMVDPEQGEYTFKPTVTHLAKNMKRSIDDLYKWKEKRDLHLKQKKEDKEKKEKEELERIQTLSHVNDHSKALLTKMNRSKMTTPMGTKMNKCSSVGSIEKTKRSNVMENEIDEDEIMVDLWPVEGIEKRYVEKVDNGEEEVEESENNIYGKKEEDDSDDDYNEEEEDDFV